MLGEGICMPLQTVPADEHPLNFVSSFAQRIATTGFSLTVKHAAG
jgi:hypothetical protein